MTPIPSTLNVTALTRKRLKMLFWMKLSEARSRNITLNLNAGLERRLRELADLEGVGYQTLIKQFLLERTYQEEVRRGILK